MPSFWNEVEIFQLHFVVVSMTIPISWGYSISCILKQPNFAVASHQLQPTAKGVLRYPLGPLREASQLMVIRTALNLIVARSHGQPPLLRKLMTHDPRPASKANVDTVWGDGQWKKTLKNQWLEKSRAEVHTKFEWMYGTVLHTFFLGI